MALLLCIDTALEIASAGVCNGNTVVAQASHGEQKNHASFIQPAIQKIIHDANVFYSDLDAVAVVNGPGSYTGLRVGLATAKGICYAARKPLILLNTLEVMAKAAIAFYNDENAMYCPMIDARRDEVFTAVYNFYFDIIMPSQPLIVNSGSFADILSKAKVYFFGSGHNKCETMIHHKNGLFTDISYNMQTINEMSQQMYSGKQFADAAYAEPNYVKSFFTPVQKI